MSDKRISQIITSGRILVSDGGWGTFLQQKGLEAGECPELWNIEHPQDVLAIAQSYVDAGSDMIETNSFGGSSIKLGSYGLAGRAFELNKAAAEISREAAGSDVLILGSIGPSGKMLMTGDVTPDELRDSFAEQARALEAGGVDALCLETFFDLTEAICAIDAAKENTTLELICTFTFDKSQVGYRTMMGTSPSEVIETVLQKGVDISGTNCGNGFEGMIDIVKEMRIASQDIPLLVHANAGLPELKENKLYYPETPEIVGEIIPRLIDAGVNIIGGCCGTTPDHIRRIKSKVSRIEAGE